MARDTHDTPQATHRITIEPTTIRGERGQRYQVRYEGGVLIDETWNPERFCDQYAHTRARDPKVTVALAQPGKLLRENMTDIAITAPSTGKRPRPAMGTNFKHFDAHLVEAARRQIKRFRRSAASGKRLSRWRPCTIPSS